MNKRNWLSYCLIPVITFAVMISILIALQPSYPKAQSTQIPTLFIHGFNGNERSFGGMINHFNSKYGWGTTSQTLRVDTDGTVTPIGTYDKTAKNPLINVIFVSNKENLKTQAGYIKNVMTYLHKEDDIKKINVVTHSMGGSSLTVYLALNHDNKERPTVNKLVYIGVPLSPTDYNKKINNEEKAQRKISQRMSETLPKSTAFLIVAGYVDKEKGGDGSVTLESALLAEDIFKHNPLQTQIVKGSSGTHSGLHENDSVDERIGKFLWSVPTK